MIEELKKKYPLAVEALRQNKYASDRGMVIIYNDGQYCLDARLLLTPEQGDNSADQIGEMLAELLNLMSKL